MIRVVNLAEHSTLLISSVLAMWLADFLCQYDNASAATCTSSLLLLKKKLPAQLKAVN